jgi:hypothetical protein
VLAYDVPVPLRVIYKTAAEIIDERRPGALRHLYRALLRALGSQSETVAAIVSVEPALAYEASAAGEICGAPWAFPHSAAALGQLPEVKLVDYSDSMKVLGCVLECIGVSD